MLDGIFDCCSFNIIVSDSAATSAARYANRVINKIGFRRHNVCSACVLVKYMPMLDVAVAAGILLNTPVIAALLTV